MVALLTNPFIKFLKANNSWPAAFNPEDTANPENELFENTNRPTNTRRESSSDDSES